VGILSGITIEPSLVAKDSIKFKNRIE